MVFNSLVLRNFGEGIYFIFERRVYRALRLILWQCESYGDLLALPQSVLLAFVYLYSIYLEARGTYPCEEGQLNRLYSSAELLVA
jgi:hypothetical protein